MSQPIRLLYVEFVFEVIVHAQKTSLLVPEHLQLLPPQNPAGQGHVLITQLVWVQLGHLPQSLTDGAAISFEFC